MAKKRDKSDELLENPEIIQEKLKGIEYWFSKHQKLSWIIVGAIVIIAGGFFGFNYYTDSQNEAAEIEMFQAIRYFESDSLSMALNGDGNNLGMLQIIDSYAMTDAANLAHFYAGYIYLKQGDYELAINQLESFSSSDLLVQPRAYSLTGDAYMDLGNYKEAADYYYKAAGYEPNEKFTPVYLMKAALAYEKLEQNDKAREVYEEVIAKYGKSQEAPSAKKYKAMLVPN